MNTITYALYNNSYFLLLDIKISNPYITNNTSQTTHYKQYITYST